MYDSAVIWDVKPLGGLHLATYTLGVYHIVTLLFWITCLVSFPKPVRAEDTPPNPGELSSQSSKKVLQTLSLRKLLNLKVDASSFFEGTIKSSPNYTILLTKGEWANLGVRNLAEAINALVPGMQMTEHYWTGPLIGSRGLSIDSNAKTLVLADNVPIVQRRHFGASQALGLPLLGDLDRIEVIHGPNALVHGGGAINGVVNMHTKRGRDHPGLWLRTEYGAVDQSTVIEGSYGVRYGKKRDLFLYAGFLQADGFMPGFTDWNQTELESLAAQGVRIRTREYEPSVKATLNWHHDQAWLKAHFFRVFASANTAVAPEWVASPQWFGAALSDLGWYRGLLSINPGYSILLGRSNSLTFSGIVQFHDYGMFTKEKSPARRRLEGGGRESFYRAEVLWKNTSIPNNSLAIGGWLGYRDFDDEDTFFNSRAGTYFESANMDWWEFSLFLEDVYQITSRVTLSGGVRIGYTQLGEIDISNLIGTAIPDAPTSSVEPVEPVADTLSVSPRIALSITMSENHILKVSYGRAFRLPDAAYFWHQGLNNYMYDNAADLTDIVTPVRGASRISLGPELVDSIELNSLNVLFDEKLSVNLSLYGNMYTDTLLWDGNTFINLPDQFFSVGGELSASTEVPLPADTSLRLRASYGYSRPLNFGDEIYEVLPALVNGVQPSDNHDQWTAFSPHQFKISARLVALSERAVFGVNLKVFSGVDTAGDLSDPNDDRSQMHPAYEDTAVIVDTSLSVYPGQFGIRVTIQNLLANETPAPRSLGTLGSSPANGQLGINERMVYLAGELRF